MQKWDGAINQRQVLPGLIRSGNLSFLSEQGRTDLLTSGISRIIDLRNRSERQIDPAPFKGHPVYLNLPMLPQHHAALDEVHATGKTNADFYRAYLDHAGNQIASIFGAILDAPPGPVLIHCHLGKDRTGLVAALAQELAGVPRSEIAADYAETDRQMRATYAAMLERQPDPDRRARLATFLVCPEEDMLGMLNYLDAQWGGAVTYLEAFGFGGGEQDHLVQRLS